MSKINLSETHINSYKTKDDIKFKKVYDEWDRINSNANRRIFLINDDNYEKFKIRQVELRYKNQLEHINDIKQNGYIGSVGLAGRF